MYLCMFATVCAFVCVCVCMFVYVHVQEMLGASDLGFLLYQPGAGALHALEATLEAVSLGAGPAQTPKRTLCNALKTLMLLLKLCSVFGTLHTMQCAKGQCHQRHSVRERIYSKRNILHIFFATIPLFEQVCLWMLTSTLTFYSDRTHSIAREHIL